MNKFVIIGWGGIFSDHRYWVVGVVEGRQALELWKEKLTAACLAADRLGIGSFHGPYGHEETLTGIFGELDPWRVKLIELGYWDAYFGYEFWQIDSSGAATRLDDDAIGVNSPYGG